MMEYVKRERVVRVPTMRICYTHAQTHTGSYGNAYATYAMGVIIMQNVPNESKHVMVNTKKKCIFKTKSIAFLQYK